jgi:hypothetical protein
MELYWNFPRRFQEPLKLLSMKLSALIGAHSNAPLAMRPYDNCCEKCLNRVLRRSVCTDAAGESLFGCEKELK